MPTLGELSQQTVATNGQTFDQNLSDFVAGEAGLKNTIGQGTGFDDMSEATRQLVAEGAAIGAGDRSLLETEASKQFVSGAGFGTPTTGGAATGGATSPAVPGATAPAVPGATTQPTDLSALIEARYGSLLNPGLTEEQIQQQEMDAVQSQIDALNALYTTKIQEEQKQGEGRLGRGRSLNAISGNAWNPFGEARTFDIERQNAAVVDQIRKEQAAELSNIYAAARGEATRRVEKQAENLSANTNAYIDSMVQAYGLSQDEAASLRDNAARVAALTGTYNGEQTLDGQAQDFEQNMDLQKFLLDQSQLAEENARANQQLDLQIEEARRAGYQVDTMQDGSVGYWDYTNGVPKFVTIGNYSKLGAGTGGGGSYGSGSGYGAAETGLADDALSAYFDTFGEYPSKADEPDVIDRYITSYTTSADPATALNPFTAGRNAQLEYKSTGAGSGGAFQIE